MITFDLSEVVAIAVGSAMLGYIGTRHWAAEIVDLERGRCHDRMRRAADENNDEEFRLAQREDDTLAKVQGRFS